ncbi:MAG: hypothetical protein JRG89_13275 [Deltaproteobacteria bacterium]|nr:hypothetical protein [Deltaproteobacteria bacterium]
MNRLDAIAQGFELGFAENCFSREETIAFVLLDFELRRPFTRFAGRHAVSLSRKVLQQHSPTKRKEEQKNN